jgi:hypothetical protein
MSHGLKQKPKKETCNVLNSTNIFRGRDSSVGIVIRLWTGKPGFEFRQGQRIFFFSPKCLACFWDPPSLQWLLGFFSQEKRGRGLNFHLVMRLIIRGATSTTRHGQEKHYNPPVDICMLVDWLCFVK